MSIIKKADKLFNNTERSNASSTWELISEFMLPNQSGIFEGEDTKGGKKTQRLYDSTAIQLVHDLAAAIHSTLTNPATKWSKLRFKDDTLNNNAQATAWLDEVNTIIHDFINESNFDTQVSKNYQAFACLGTMALFIEEADRELAGEFNGLRFEAWHLSQIAIVENKDGAVDTVYRKFKMTAKQIAEKFKNPPEDIVKELDENGDKEFEIYHCVAPRDKSLVKLNEFGLAPAKNRPFMSLYMIKGLDEDKAILEESGYYEFPVMVTRWSTMPGEVYGRGPGHIALPDVRSLNELKRLALEAASTNALPSYLVDKRQVIGQLDLRPNKVNIVKDVDRAIRQISTEARFDLTQFTSEELRNSIKSIFFMDKLLLPPRQETGEMTAFEIQQRLEQMQKVLGPTLSRLNSEFLTPLVVRIFNILLRSNVLPQLPPILEQEGINIDIRFVNPLSRAQEIEEINNIRSFLLNISELAQVSPEVLDYIDGDAIVKAVANARSIPPNLLKDDREVNELRQQRAQAQQAQTAVDQGVGLADII
jgi:hypothetical protein